MSQSLSVTIVHIIFSTRERRAVIHPVVAPKLHAYLAVVARSFGCEAYRVGGVADHVHLAIRLSRTVSISDLVQELKTTSSKWMKTQLDRTTGDQTVGDGFSWQRGYGCFSVSPTHLELLLAYIDKQVEHHKTRSFQEEYRSFLEKYGVAYNEKYVWD